jgi:hypothetical protein
MRCFFIWVNVLSANTSTVGARHRTPGLPRRDHSPIRVGAQVRSQKLRSAFFVFRELVGSPCQIVVERHTDDPRRVAYRLACFRIVRHLADAGQREVFREFDFRIDTATEIFETAGGELSVDLESNNAVGRQVDDFLGERILYCRNFKSGGVLNELRRRQGRKHQ